MKANGSWLKNAIALPMKKMLMHIASRCGKESPHPLKGSKRNLMYSSSHLIKNYLGYYLTASNSKGHGMHSPFVFDFILYVLNDKKKYKIPQEIENLRNELLKDDTFITIQDLGAGSRVQSSKQRTIKRDRKS